MWRRLSTIVQIRRSRAYRESDYARIKCFELAVKGIRKRNVKGSVAKVGVFRGEFARYINHTFSDKLTSLRRGKL